eukprot:2592669-Prymnesium_polylepis.1
MHAPRPRHVRQCHGAAGTDTDHRAATPPHYAAQTRSHPHRHATPHLARALPPPTWPLRRWAVRSAKASHAGATHHAG